jgi:phytoene dehydrogenase-like protein
MIYDAIVIGSGPNGLAAAIRLAQAGRSVKVFEAGPIAGGGMRSEALTLSGFTHDVCSAVHPLGIASPYFRSLKLERFGLNWIHSPVALAHPLENSQPVLLMSSVDDTANNLGEDGEAYRHLMQPLADHWEEILSDALRPALHWPKHPAHGPLWIKGLV